MWTKKFKDGVMHVWDSERPLDQPANLIQPFNPLDGKDWASEAQATEWADKAIYDIENPPVIEEVVEDVAAVDPAPVEEAPIA